MSKTEAKKIINKQSKIIFILIALVILLEVNIILDKEVIENKNNKIENEQKYNLELVTESRQLIDNINELNNRIEDLELYEELYENINKIQQTTEFRYYPGIPLTIKEQEYIQILSEQHGFSEAFIYGLIKAESDFNKEIVSYNGTSIGIMQINKNSADDIARMAGLEKYDLYNFYDNVKMGITYLVYLREYYKQQGITSEEDLFYYITNAYNRGIHGLDIYIRLNNTYICRYSETILRHKCEIEQNYYENCE